MKREISVDTIENALVEYELEHHFVLNCSRFELSIYLKHYLEG
jgi:hypothetical protein